jgi:Co/Zn/Cd efflux system component
MRYSQQRLEIRFFGWSIRADGVVGIIGAMVIIATTLLLVGRTGDIGTWLLLTH